MKFSMSDDEIRVSFHTAKDQKTQVRVLAELNATTQQAMAEKLKALGCDVPELPEVKQKPLRAHDVLFDEGRARALFAEGKSDLDCAEMLGISVYKFAEWRRRNGMKRPMGGAAQPKPKKTKTASWKTKPPMPPEVETPEPVPAPETVGGGSQAQLAASGKPASAEAIGEVLLDLAKRYPGLTLTVNGEEVSSLCLIVRVPMNGEDAMSSTLDLEVV